MQGGEVQRLEDDEREERFISAVIRSNAILPIPYTGSNKDIIDPKLVMLSQHYKFWINIVDDETFTSIDHALDGMHRAHKVTTQSNPVDNIPVSTRVDC